MYRLMLLLVGIVVDSAPVPELIQRNGTPRRHLVNIPSAALKREENRDGTRELQTKVTTFANLCRFMRALHLPSKYDGLLENEEVKSLDLLGLMTVEELSSIGFKLGEFHRITLV